MSERLAHRFVAEEGEDSESENFSHDDVSLIIYYKYWVNVGIFIAETEEIKQRFWEFLFADDFV